jgi:hypothetical protein
MLMNAQQDSGFSLDVSGSFADADTPLGDSLTFTSDDLPDSLSINEDGVITGTPTNTDAVNSPITVTITATDADGEQTSSDLTITIANVNDGPTSSAIPDANAQQDSGFSLDVSGSFADADTPLGDTLTFTSDDLPDSLSINEDGVITGTPTNTDAVNSPITVTITATDADGEQTSSDLTITVANVNDGPTSSAIPDANAQQDSGFSLDVSGSFADADTPLGDTLTFTSDDLPDSLSINEDGVITGTPTNTDAVNSPITVTITATDADGEQISSDLTITVANVNDGPTSSAIPDAAATEDANFSLDISGSFTDIDIPLGDVLTFSSNDLPTNLSISEEGIITGTPTNDDVSNSPIAVTITATDSEGTQVSSNLAISIANTNDAPISISPIPDMIATESETFSLDVSSHFFDIDIGDNLTYTSEFLPDGLTISSVGIITGSPTDTDASNTPLSITITATDSENLQVTSNFNLTVEGIIPDNLIPVEIEINDVKLGKDTTLPNMVFNIPTDSLSAYDANEVTDITISNLSEDATINSLEENDSLLSSLNVGGRGSPELYIELNFSETINTNTGIIPELISETSLESSDIKRFSQNQSVKVYLTDPSEFGAILNIVSNYENTLEDANLVIAKLKIKHDNNSDVGSHTLGISLETEQNLQPQTATLEADYDTKKK